ncbi:MAG: flagellar basal body-associated FliL family protein [Rhodospirillaceae bacterium]|nr:flagellar basal body-associated FliL family protein [Rhodospirillaceae bacterium]
MADEEDFEGDEPEFDAGAAGGGGGGKKKLLLLIVVPLVLVLGGAAAAYFTGLADPLLAMFHKQAPPAEGAPAEGGHEAPAAKAAEGEHGAATQAVMYELPEMLVNINTAGRAKSFLKIKVSLELSNPDDINRIENVKPRIIDNFQVYLRELRLEDLQGAAGVYRLREELLNRVNAAARPAVVKDVLFQEMIVQ